MLFCPSFKNIMSLFQNNKKWVIFPMNQSVHEAITVNIQQGF